MYTCTCPNSNLRRSGMIIKGSSFHQRYMKQVSSICYRITRQRIHRFNFQNNAILRCVFIVHVYSSSFADVFINHLSNKQFQQSGASALFVSSWFWYCISGQTQGNRRNFNGLLQQYNYMYHALIRLINLLVEDVTLLYRMPDPFVILKKTIFFNYLY